MLQPNFLVLLCLYLEMVHRTSNYQGVRLVISVRNTTAMGSGAGRAEYPSALMTKQSRESQRRYDISAQRLDRHNRLLLIEAAGVTKFEETVVSSYTSSCWIRSRRSSFQSGRPLYLPSFLHSRSCNGQRLRQRLMEKQSGR